MTDKERIAFLEAALEEAEWAWESWQLDDVRKTGRVCHEFGDSHLPNLAAWLRERAQPAKEDPHAD